MKGEYVEQHHNQPKHETPDSMFSKLHHHPIHLPFSPHFQLSRDCEDDDNNTTTTRNTSPSTTTTAAATPTTPATKNTVPADGATIEVVRRPRGRPPGSKNKAKPPIIITRDPEPAMSPYILEVPAGTDVVEAICRFCRRKNIGICVLTGSGVVANVTLRQPSTTPGATVTFHGRFDILSLSATFLPQATSYHVPNTFTISLAGPQGQIVGGMVAGGLMAAGTVFIIAASFNNPSFCRLPFEEEGMNSGSAGGVEGHSPDLSGAGGGDSGHGPSGGVGESCGGSGGGGGMGGMYSCHLPSDVIWAPTAARPAPPY